ncbi:MAG: recombinase RecA [Pseudoflavonifractor sp.]|nr:recombinase RecA [Pseudoflavonifractor sp.]
MEKTKKTTIKKKDKDAAPVDPKKAKLDALTAALGRIEKNYGRGAIMKLGEEVVENVEVIPTGSIGLNFALGVGGFPRGRIIEIFGPESSGKTTLAIHAIAEAQKAGGIAAIIDAEHAFDRFYAEKLGVDVNNLLISQPDNGEQALEITEQLIRSSAVDIIVVDSVAALTPKSEIDGTMGDRNMGLQARLMSQAMRKLTGAIARSNTTCIFINQLREKIGAMFGPSETTTGGNALKFYASVRVDIRSSTAVKDGDDVLGRTTRVKVVKNKVAPPFRRAQFDIMFGEGISRPSEIIDLGVDYNVIQKSGSWFSYDGTKLAQGREAAKKVIADNPELAEELEAKIMAALKEAAANGTLKSPGSKKSKKKTSSKSKSEPEVSRDDEDEEDEREEAEQDELDFDDTMPDDFSIEEDAEE